MSPEECSAPAAGMLTGYRVLDLCDAKGVLCTKLMADLGADVIAIEPPGGSPLRIRTPFYHDRADPEMSLYFWYFHTNKRSITLNLETPDGQALFNDLVNTADVWVETTPPGYLDALGLDYSHLQALNPRLIMTSITGFGREGPPALDATVRYPGAPYALSETPWQLRRHPPALGEHNEAMYGDLLGIRADEIDQYTKDEVFY